MELNRGNSIRNKIIFIISFLLLVNVSYADVSKNALENKINNTEVRETDVVTLKPSLNTNDSLENHSQIGVSNYLQMIAGLLGIVVFIFAIAWIIKRTGTLNPAHSTNLKVVAGLNVGQREKIIVVQVMDEQLLVGVTQTNIQLLSKLEQPMSESNFQTFGGFQEKLQAAITGLKNKKTENKSSRNEFKMGDEK